MPERKKEKATAKSPYPKYKPIKEQKICTHLESNIALLMLTKSPIPRKKAL